MIKIFIPRSFSVTGMLFALIITCCTNFSLAQEYKKIDSLLKKLASTTNDTARVWALHDLAIVYLYSNNDSSAWFAQQAMVLSKKINYTRGEIRSMNDIGNVLSITGSYSSAIEIFLSALEKSENLKDETMKATSLGNLAEAYNEQGDFKQAIRYTTGSLTIDVANHDTL
jgi:tetratricopeptide (TPR) repeat protein